jgi:hypothetical protein
MLVVLAAVPAAAQEGALSGEDGGGLSGAQSGALSGGISGRLPGVPPPADGGEPLSGVEGTASGLDEGEGGLSSGLSTDGGLSSPGETPRRTLGPDESDEPL